ncbi:molybdopterin-containing oxidoreductase family protein [Xiamenia xianingshaonis]|uniref:Molybdopterin-dependent oxidoreductase n=1 Tax=Xiamenia xianingshaonis TaxID=2682776 RepID=A0A9E6MRT7_9ACTN|nr:molybdopterin-dependent oxidoreductase [Xiamenia xianingshaonis]NHM13648.1 molybdopterin-dependent oxidoreductase [Xiamenia xianingshaonis]QTU85020.1 molybdopterin-dependent oxidoreductase [Xiamenia xianingshaonis]
MSETEERPTNCQYCGYGCALLARVKDGRVTGVRPDPSRYPYGSAVMASCKRWPMNVEALDAPDRVNVPLRRVGARGSGQWERVSWDEALDDIAARLRSLSAEHGPGVLASAIGGPHASYWPLHRFMNLFGSPNNMGIGQICWNPRIWMDLVTFGWTVELDVVRGLTSCVVVWGTNPAQSDNSAFWQHLQTFAQEGGDLVVIDPRRTEVAELASVWLAPRPGTDTMLALALLHVIIEEGLEDRTFVDAWCHGFDELVEVVAPWTAEAAAEACDVDADDVRKAARLIAAGPTAFVSGRGIDQVGAAVGHIHRAICCLRAVTGNVDRPGACVLAEAPDFASELAMEMSDEAAPSCRDLSLNRGRTPLQCPEGYDALREITEKLGRTAPRRYLTSAHPDLVLHAMETGEPYPIRALIVQATNPLVTYGGSARVRRALEGLDLLVVLEYRLTPTAAIADYVLPIAGAIERPMLQVHGGVANAAYGGPAAVEPYYERKRDYDVFRELGLRLGQTDAWPQATLEEAFAAELAPAGVSWEQFCETGLYWPPPAFNKHERIGDDGRPAGFATTTGKIELASEFLPRFGGFRTPQPVLGGHMGESRSAAGAAGNPSGASEAAADAFPFTLVTGARRQPYNASMYFENPRFRAACSAPRATVSPKLAARLGLAPGAPVEVSTRCGSAKYLLDVADMRDDVVSVDYGWWHPEWPCGDGRRGGADESSANAMTVCAIEEPLVGSWSYNALPCAISPTADQLSWTSVEGDAPDSVKQ